MPIVTDPAAGDGLPFVLRFPTSEAHCQTFATRLDKTLAEDWRDRFCPVIGVAVELLDLSDRALSERLLDMRGAEGTALIGDLLAEIDAAAGEMRLFLQGFAVLNTRIKRGLKAAGLELSRET